MLNIKTMFYLFIFLLGLAVGSFLNCIIYRLRAGGSFLGGRSYCPHCKHQLNWHDLIPVLSFLFLRGRCRYCKKRISFRYPLVELATGLIFFLIFNYQLSIFSYFLACFLIVIFVYDLKHYIIPDKVIYPAIAVALIYRLLRFDLLATGNFLLSAIGAAAFFGAIVLISRGKWMGIGDIKLGGLMGLLLGWPEVSVALFLAFFTGAIIGIGLIVTGKKTLKSEVPFGPFLIAGTFVSLFWGEMVIDWYLHLLSL